MIVEDESLVAMSLKHEIESFGFDVVATAGSAEDAYIKALHYTPDIIVMDINLKGAEDGIDTAMAIVSQQPTCIIYLTAFNDDKTIERAVQTQPAAYLIKPYDSKELLAAIKIALMRLNHSDTLHVRRGDIVLDAEFSYESCSQQLICCGEYVHLTWQEHLLLKLLLDARRSVVGIYDMENTLWPDKAPQESTRRALVSRLRSKLKHQFIDTIPGVGYRLKY